MDLTWVIGVVLVLIVAFFAYQWFSVASAKKSKTRAPAPALAPAPPAPAANHGEASPPPPHRSEQLPVVAGQSEAELMQKEPTQRPTPPSNQQPVTHDGKAPAEFTENLRRPEQAFHDASGPPPTLKVSDLPAGRAVEPSGQGFSPELAQNDGPMIGNSVYAFDGMEPTGFATF